MYEQYGMKFPKTLDTTEIRHWAKKFNIPQDKVFVLDTNYMVFLKTLPVFDSARISDTTKKWKYKVRNNHAQPMQALYFDPSGKLVSYHVNCDFGGFPDLKFNAGGNFNVFVPVSTSYIFPEITFSLLQPWIRTLRNKPLPSQLYPVHDYTIVVFWCRFGGRQTKRFVRTIQDNLKLAGDTKYSILYVNDDNFQCKDAYK